MKQGWNEISLKEICKTQYGYTASATDTDTGVKFVRITDIVPDFIDWSNVPFCEISEKDFLKYKLNEGDLVVARTGATVGYAKQIRKNSPNAVFASYLVKLIPSEKVDKRFLGILVESNIYKDFIQAIAGGSAQPNANANDLTLFKFRIPPLPTQQRIASILSAYDDLIAINNQRIKLLEQTARELYKEWFVRMRFPATAGKPGYKEAKFKKGIPEKWETKTLDEFGKIYTGKTPSTKVPEYYGGDIPFIKTPDLHKSLFVFETEERLTEKGNNTQKRSSLPANSICVSCIGTGGIVAITTAEKSQTNQQINSLIPSNRNQMEFLYYRILGLKETIELFGGTGATMTNLSKGKFEKLKILFPTKELVESYHKIVYPMFDQIKILQHQNTQLRQIRDRLLPRLISGKLQVSEL